MTKIRIMPLFGEGGGGGQGIQGATGAQGIQGFIGFQGIAGESGIQGIQGSMGGSRSVWYGLQSQYENLPSYEPDTDYYISDLYYSEIENTPDLSVYALKSELVPGIQGVQGIQGTVGPQVSTNTITAVVTFTDQTTATYNIYVQ